MNEQSYGVDRVTDDEKQTVRQTLDTADTPLSATTILERGSLDSLPQVVSALHALIHDGIASHNIDREYYLLDT